MVSGGRGGRAPVHRTVTARVVSAAVLGIVEDRASVVGVNWVAVAAAAAMVAAASGNGLVVAAAAFVVLSVVFSSRASDQGVSSFFGLLSRSTRLPWGHVDRVRPVARPLFHFWRVVTDEDVGHNLVGFSTLTRRQQITIMRRLVDRGLLVDVPVHVPDRWGGQAVEKLRAALDGGSRARQ